MLKRILKIVLGLVAVVVVLVFAAGFFLNTNQYKSALQEAIYITVGYRMEIAGDLEVNFFPSVGLTLNDVRIKNPAFPQELASTSSVVLNVNTRELFSGNLLIQELSADNLHINYFTDSGGNNIWTVAGSIDDRLPQQSPIESVITSQVDASLEDELAIANNEIVSVSFERMRISNASIDVLDVSTGTNLKISNLDLDSLDTNIDGRPFNIDLSFDFLNAGMRDALSMGLRSRVTADLNQGAIHLSDMNLNLTPMLVQGNLQLNDINDDMRIEGILQSNSFDIMGLMQTLGLAAEAEEFSATANSAPPFSFNVSFAGDESQVAVSDFTAKLGEAQIKADANIRMATDFIPMSIRYNVTGGAIDLSPYLSETNTAEPVASGAPAATGSTATAQDTPLPIEALQAFNVTGSIALESLTANNFVFRDINVFTNLEDGLLDIESQPIGLFDGSLQGNVRLDARKSDADFSTQFSVANLNIAELTPYVAQLDAVTGNLNVEVDYSANGATVNGLLDSITGSSAFTVTENSVDIGLLKQIFTAIAALSPSGASIGQWPDVIQFSELIGVLVFEDGIKENQTLNIRMDNIDIQGNGGLDLTADTFDYDMQFTVLGGDAVQTIPIDELYHDVRWPVTCAAALTDPVSQYCGPDFTRVREIFTQMATNELRRQGEDAIIDAVPEELQDTARSLLRGLLN